MPEQQGNNGGIVLGKVHVVLAFGDGGQERSVQSRLFVVAGRSGLQQAP
jgi:hypothetical protein